jgi:hypothetical protein
MSSLRRQRGTFGSNKKPFAGGNSPQIGESNSDFGAASIRVEQLRISGILPPSALIKRFDRTRFFDRIDAAERFGPDRESERINPFTSSVGRMNRIRREREILRQERDERDRNNRLRLRALEDPQVGLIKKPGRENPLLVDRRLSMGHFNSTSPRNSILSAGASQV